MNFQGIFKKIKESFTIQKIINVEGYDLHFVLEPLTSAEELKILEVCGNLEGGSFVAQLKRSSLAYAIKKINDLDFIDDFIEYEDEKGNRVKETKYICLTRQIDVMPAALRDTLFEAFSNMQLEVESIVNKNVKYERFTVQEISEKDVAAESSIPEGFRKIDESKDQGSLTETERLNNRVKEEIEREEIKHAQALNKPNE